MIYNVTETFHSIKGEGLYTGVAMKFIRLSGCSVGKAPTEEQKAAGGIPIVGPLMTEVTPAFQCHTYDGRPFWCDTDFHNYAQLTEEELLADAWEDRIVITGGEPLIWGEKLRPLLDLIKSKKKFSHLETSGTIDWERLHLEFDWIAVAPKLGVLSQCIRNSHEVKLLVDENFDVAKIPVDCLSHYRVYLQPVNPPYGLSRENMALCFKLQEQFPKWIFSPQLHKLLGVK